MSKYYDLNGFHSKTKSHGEASIAAPTDTSKLWNWNGVEWIGLPLDFKYPPANPTAVVEVPVTTTPEPTTTPAPVTTTPEPTTTEVPVPPTE